MAKSLTKSQIIGELATCAELKKKDVACVLEGLAGLIKTAVGKKGPGLFVVPGLLKITVVQKPAVPILSSGTVCFPLKRAVCALYGCQSGASSK